MASNTVAITTDTATICIFDTAAMIHRKDDVGDWWSIPANELAEVRSANALFFNLGEDGDYVVGISHLIDPIAPGYCLKAPSGRVFVGPGEEMSGGGFEPTGEWGGVFVTVQQSHQRVSVAREGRTLTINFQPAELFENDLADLIRL